MNTEVKYQDNVVIATAIQEEIKLVVSLLKNIDEVDVVDIFSKMSAILIELNMPLDESKSSNVIAEPKYQEVHDALNLVYDRLKDKGIVGIVKATEYSTEPKQSPTRGLSLISKYLTNNLYSAIVSYSVPNS